jgi:large subunit ribosomal protein L32
MAVPKKKPSRSRRGLRRAHDSLSAPALSVCPSCGEPKMPHRICPSCKTYKGRVFFKVEEEK